MIKHRQVFARQSHLLKGCPSHNEAAWERAIYIGIALELYRAIVRTGKAPTTVVDGSTWPVRRRKSATSILHLMRK
jgi:hypothetical protein